MWKTAGNNLHVGRVFRTITMSATLLFVIIVPFLKDPTWRASSTACLQVHYVMYAPQFRGGQNNWKTPTLYRQSGSKLNLANNYQNSSPLMSAVQTYSRRKIVQFQTKICWTVITYTRSTKKRVWHLFPPSKTGKFSSPYWTIRKRI